MKTDELRSKFLDFFESKGHTVVRSDSLVPKGDPTLLFTSAGMNQFKDQFMGNDIAYRRAASCQKCLRTADLERVGKTSYHHTFFEMLGNFSFGDYFKKEAVSWAWEFMTEALKLPKEKLWVSVYEDDEETCAIWKEEAGIPENKIVKLGDKENFWPSNAKTEGPNGPCGPCSEIFYDRGAGVGCERPGCDPACDCGRFIEVWNLVFTQFNRTGPGRLEPLASKNIDTGMGLERLASVMQGVYVNFETDILKPIVESVKNLIPESDTGNQAPAYAIADHIRAISFAILDGVMPSNEGRGYVIRKLIRTAFLRGRPAGPERPFLYKLVFSVASVMKTAYPEINRRHEDIAAVIKSEEEFFVRHLDPGRAEMLYEERLRKISSSETAAEDDIAVLSAAAACFLNDTYGIPVELTRRIAAAKGHVSSGELWLRAYEGCVEELRERSRKKSAFKNAIFSGSRSGAVINAVPKTEFVGYKSFTTEARVLRIFRDDKEIEELKEKSEIQIILDRTSFYAEAGGQVGDTGVLTNKDARIEVLDTKRADGVFIHIGRLVNGCVRTGDTLRASVDRERREAIAKNHTATHLLQNALRKVLGEHVHQSGSVVEDKRLRFDFTHPKKLLPRELERIEDLVNAKIQDSDVVAIEDDVDIEQAMEKGAIALFGEKYDKRVRIAAVGDYSKELCGGTHAANTSDIRLFKIISEGSVAAGLRRIEALTDKEVDAYVEEEEKNLIKKLDDALLSAEAAAGRIDDKELRSELNEAAAKARAARPAVRTPLSLRDYIKWDRATKPGIKELIDGLGGIKSKIEKKLFSAKLESSKAAASGIIREAESVKDTLIVVKELKGADARILRALSDEIQLKAKSSFVVLAAPLEDKISFVCALTPDLVKKGLHAGRIVKEMARITAGGGGGREDFALAGGKDLSKLKEALEYAYTLSRQELEK